MTTEDDERRARLLEGLARIKAARPEQPAEQPSPDNKLEEGAQPDDAPPRGLPKVLRRMILPWWHRRAADLAAALERAVEAGEEVVQRQGKRVAIEALIHAAEEADAMIERLEAEEAAGFDPPPGRHR